MALKDLLVCVGNDPACAERIDVAVCIAAAHEAHLTGLCVMAWPPIPGYAETQFPQEVREWQAGQLREACREAEQLFRGRAGGAGVLHEWRAAEGNVTAITLLHARYSDLTIAGQGIDLGGAPPEFASLPEELALGVGRPVLVVPRYGTFPTVGERVLIAWNGSREATRAVNT